MDYLINAENHVGIGCCRKVFDVCFENNAAGEKVLSFECRYRYSATHLDTDHLQCNKDQPMSCEWCHVGSPAVCCDIHNPSEFSSFASVVAKQPSIPPRSRIAKYERTQTDNDLQDALDQWREKTTATVFGWAHLNDMGPSILMCSATLEHIIDCAHYHKINSVLDLKREIGWLDADEFGSAIITLIHTHSLPLLSPFVLTPLRPTTSVAVNTCQVWVYSGRGSGEVRTKMDEGREQRAGQEVSPAGVGDRLDSTTKDNKR